VCSTERSGRGLDHAGEFGLVHWSRGVLKFNMGWVDLIIYIYGDKGPGALHRWHSKRGTTGHHLRPGQGNGSKIEFNKSLSYRRGSLHFQATRISCFQKLLVEERVAAGVRFSCLMHPKRRGSRLADLFRGPSFFCWFGCRFTASKPGFSFFHAEIITNCIFNVVRERALKKLDVLPQDLARPTHARGRINEFAIFPTY
jgi:hypothetical protein